MCWPSCWFALSPEHWQRINDLVRIFVSLLYATKEEMGFDPTVKRVRLNKETCYVYEVNDRFFRTVRSIFHGRVHCITGRKTRVWEAVEVGGSSWKEIGEEKNGGKHYALKDVWLDEGSDTEGDNLNKIFSALDKVNMGRWNGSVNTTDSQGLEKIIGEVLRTKQYCQYFMGIECDMRGRNTKERAEGASPDGGIFDAGPTQEPPGKMEKRTTAGSTQSKQTSNLSGRAGSMPLSTAAARPRDYKAKFQYRLIYSDVGKPLDTVESLKKFSKGIYDASIGGSLSCSMDS